jgi:hypothetical protein
MVRSAPAVAVHASGGAGWRGVQAVLPAWAAAASVALMAGHLEWGAMPQALAVAAASAAIGFAAWRLASRPATRLVWDGQQWAADSRPGELSVMIDLDRALLLRLVPTSGSRTLWVAVTAREAGPAWHGLRAAVYSRPSQDTPRVLVPDRVAD